MRGRDTRPSHCGRHHLQDTRPTPHTSIRPYAWPSACQRLNSFIHNYFSPWAELHGRLLDVCRYIWGEKQRCTGNENCGHVSRGFLCRIPNTTESTQRSSESNLGKFYSWKWFINHEDAPRNLRFCIPTSDTAGKSNLHIETRIHACTLQIYSSFHLLKY